MKFIEGRIKFNKRFFTVVLLTGLAPSIFMFLVDFIDGTPETDKGIDKFAEITIYSLVYTTLISLVVANSWNFIDNNYPWSKPIKRIAIGIPTTTIVAVSTMVVLTWIDVNLVTSCNPSEAKDLYKQNIQITLIMNIIVIFTFESLFFFEQWKESEVNNERLQKENINSQFASLKNQVNPHFLFNSLNSLSALIHEDADRAEEFVDRLASVYRYVLDVKDKDLIDLREEIEFIQSFLHIQQIRFGDNLKIEIKVDEASLGNQVPPLSLQLLVENCIKHNRITSEDPLHISIHASNGFLMVSNNLQVRSGEQVDSTGVGLQNLKDRYKNFTHKELEFERTDKDYIARIPLIAARI